MHKRPESSIKFISCWSSSITRPRRGSTVTQPHACLQRSVTHSNDPSKNSSAETTPQKGRHNPSCLLFAMATSEALGIFGSQVCKSRKEGCSCSVGLPQSTYREAGHLGHRCHQSSDWPHCPRWRVIEGRMCCLSPLTVRCWTVASFAFTVDKPAS